jgi:hypothetical protein
MQSCEEKDDGVVMNYMLAGGIWLWHAGRTYPAISLEQGWRTCGTGAQYCTRKTSLARGIHRCPIFFISFARPASLCCDEYVYIYTYLTACRLYMNYRCYQITLRVKHFYTNRSGAKCWLDIYQWGAGLAVTGRIRDIGQNILQSSFETGSSSGPVTAKFSSLSHSSRSPLLRNILR